MSTSAPAAQSSGELYSAPLWLRPSFERMKIMPVGQKSVNAQVSWPAPLGILWTGYPSFSQASQMTF